MQFEGKVAIVTGASSGLGRSTCTVFSEMGARVVGIARREALGKALEREVHDAGGHLTFVPGDVSRVDDCRRVVEAAFDRYGRVDVLVNCAGTHAPRSHVLQSHTVTEDEWDTVVDTNLKGTFFCCRYALEHMTRQGSGVIINVSSKNGEQPTAGMSAYNSSKAAILHLSRTLALEYFPYGIRVFGVSLGGMDTAMGAEAGRSMFDVLSGGQGNWEPIDMSELTLSPVQVARGLALLCHDDAAVFFSTVVRIDGGMSAAMETGGAFRALDLAGALQRYADANATPG